MSKDKSLTDIIFNSFRHDVKEALCSGDAIGMQRIIEDIKDHVGCNQTARDLVEFGAFCEYLLSHDGYWKLANHQELSNLLCRCTFPLPEWIKVRNIIARGFIHVIKRANDLDEYDMELDFLTFNIANVDAVGLLNILRTDGRLSINEYCAYCTTVIYNTDSSTTLNAIADSLDHIAKEENDGDISIVAGVSCILNAIDYRLSLMLDPNSANIRPEFRWP